MKKRIAKKILKNPRQYAVYSYYRICVALEKHLRYLLRGDQYSLDYDFALFTLDRLMLGKVRVFDLNLPLIVKTFNGRGDVA